jgi:hypothetical protein
MAFKTKNHVTPNAKRITGLLKGKYGFGLELLEKALQGDQTALKTIGEAARQGQQIQELMPLLTDAYLANIKGTEEYNKGISAILKQGASSAISIDKATAQASLANTKYVNQRKEGKLDYMVAKATETTRHDYALNYVRLKAYIDQYLTKVDNESKLIDQANRPELKQIDEEARYNMAAAKHLLQHGENANLELIPHREYATVAEGEKRFSFKEKLGQLASSLGF